MVFLSKLIYQFSLSINFVVNTTDKIFRLFIILLFCQYSASVRTGCPKHNYTIITVEEVHHLVFYLHRFLGIMRAGLLQQKYSSGAVCTQGCPYFTAVSHLLWSEFSSSSTTPGNSSTGQTLLLDDFRQLDIHYLYCSLHFCHLFR